MHEEELPSLVDTLPTLAPSLECPLSPQAFLLLAAGVSVLGPFLGLGLSVPPSASRLLDYN